ncbi:MAG TPA: DUF998 domain-containing protein [Candidatus Saccharimonadales bacterium]|nr:DUF998 domain-containing protein [Candidatus Saccharimonadales bacterium]
MKTLRGYLPWIIPPLSVLAGLCFNNWVLGLFLNPSLYQHNGSVSEFSAVSQPDHWIFRSLDISAGVLMVILTAAIFWFVKNHISGKTMAALLAILGVSNIFDAIFTLPCSETLSQRCVIPVNLSLTHYQMPVHGYSSIIIAICYLLVPLAGLIYANRRNLRFLRAASWLAILVAIADFVLASLQYISSQSFSVRTSGFGQEVHMLVFAAWIIVLGFCGAWNSDGAIIANKTKQSAE